MAAGYRYTEEQWKAIIKDYCQAIKELGGVATEVNIVNKRRLNRNLAYTQLNVGMKKGYLKRVREIGGQVIRNNNVWTMTEKGEGLLKSDKIKSDKKEKK
jgi:ribosomal protein S6